MPLAYKLLTVEEFLDNCPTDQRHYQLFDGVIVAMAPPGGRHQIIAATIGALLYTAVEAKMPGCSVRAQAGIAPRGVSGRDHFETDVAVTCEPLDERHRGIVVNPLLIVEVLSPSTERDDVFIKLPAYRRIPGLQEILYIESERVGATVHRRARGRWRETVLSASGDRLQLRTVSIDIELGRLYRGIPGLVP